MSFLPDSPEYTLNNTLSTTVTEGTSVYTYQFILDAGPIPTDFNWTKDSQVVASDNRITLSVDSITIRNITRDDNGTYIVTSRNVAGMDMANFTLDVQCEYCFMDMVKVCYDNIISVQIHHLSMLMRVHKVSCLEIPSF